MSPRASSPSAASSSVLPESVLPESARPELAPPPPPLAERVFGERLPLVRRYADLLAGPGIVQGLLGPREVGRLWERHLLNCAALAPLIPADASVLDLGSGAGLPGLVLALARPDLRVRLVEPMQRRCTFLAAAVDELGLDRVTVIRARAEELAGTLSVDVVTARAVAPLATLAALATPLLRAGGLVLALKGATAEAELTACRSALPEWGVRSADVVETGDDETWPRATVIRLVLATRPAVHRPRGRKGRST